MMDSSMRYAMFLKPHKPKEAFMKQTFVYVGLDVDDTLQNRSH